MKSAYELAMERLEKASPSISLTEDQKKEIAEVDSVCRAKIAEKELFLKDEIRKAQGAGNLEEVESLEKQLASEIRRLQEDCEAKKEKLRASFAEIAHASRVLARASSPSRIFLTRSPHAPRAGLMKNLFRRDAETNTRDACATQRPTAQRLRCAQCALHVSADWDRESRAYARA